MPTYLPNFKLSLRQASIALIFFSVLLFLYRFEAITKITTHYLGTDQYDGGIYVWLFEHNLNYFWNSPYFNTKAFYPYTQSLAWSDNYLLPAILAKPFITLGLKKIVAYNLCLLLASFLNGFCCFKLAYQFSKNFAGSLLAGLCFMGFPFLTLHLGHPQLQYTFWIPLAVSCYCSFLANPKFSTALLLGLLSFLSFLTTVYYTFFILLILCFLTLGLIIYQPRGFSWRNVTKLASGFLIGFLPIILVIEPYLAVKGTFGARALEHTDDFSASIYSYFTAPVQHLFLHSTYSFSNYEASLYPGIMCWLTLIFLLLKKFKQQRLRLLLLGTLLFLVTGIILQFASPELSIYILWITLLTALLYLYITGQYERRLKHTSVSNSGLVNIFLLQIFIFFFLSLGPVETGEIINHRSSLYSILYSYFPGVSALRAVGRFGIVVNLFACLLIPFYWKPHKLKNKFLLLVLFIITIIDFYPRFYPLEDKHPAPRLFQEIKSLVPKDSVIAVLPMTTEPMQNRLILNPELYAKTNIPYQNWLINQNVTLVNGYSGQVSRNMRDFPWKLENFPDELSLKTLNTVAGLNYILIHSKLIKNFNADAFKLKINSYDNLKIIKQDAQGNFLIKFTANIELTNDFYLQVPSYPYHQTLRFELKSNQLSTEKLWIPLYFKKHYKDEPFRFLELEPDGLWHKFEIILPKTSDTVRPLQMRFKIGEASVSLRNSQVIP